MNNVEKFEDETGVYIGQLENGIPHGKGIKSYHFGIKVECFWNKGLKVGPGFLDFGVLILEVKFAKGYPKRLLKFPEIFKIRFPKTFSFQFPLKISESNGDFFESFSPEPVHFSLCCFRGEILNNYEFIQKKLGILNCFTDDRDIVITESINKIYDGFCEVKTQSYRMFGIYKNDVPIKLYQSIDYEKLKIINELNQEMKVKNTIHYYKQLQIKVKILPKLNQYIITYKNFKADFFSKSQKMKIIRGTKENILELYNVAINSGFHILYTLSSGLLIYQHFKLDNID